MPKSKFKQIYKDLKEKIETQEYEFQELLPSENKMVGIYDCSRNTVRRAIADPDKITVVQIAPAVRTAWGENLGLTPEQAREYFEKYGREEQ